MANARRHRGFTLIELGVALLVAGLLMAVAIPTFSSVTRAQLRSRSGELAGAIRAMYGHAAVSGRSCRLAFDLDGGSYWAECAKGVVRLSREHERTQNGARLESAQEKLAADLAEEQQRGRELSAKDKVRAELAAKDSFTAANIPDLHKIQLGKQVHFSDIWVQHQAERYTSGRAFLYFWPSGLTESAGIRLAQGDDVYSLIVSPLTGRVRVVNGQAEAPGEK
jgi:general secretion pathway protein H